MGTINWISRKRRTTKDNKKNETSKEFDWANYAKDNLIKVVWTILLSVGGALLLVYFSRIGFLPDIKLADATAVLAATAVIGIFSVVVLASCLVIPALCARSFIEKLPLRKAEVNSLSAAYIGLAGLVILVVASLLGKSRTSTTQYDWLFFGAVIYFSLIAVIGLHYISFRKRKHWSNRSKSTHARATHCRNALLVVGLPVIILIFCFLYAPKWFRRWTSAKPVKKDQEKNEKIDSLKMNSRLSDTDDLGKGFRIFGNGLFLFGRLIGHNLLAKEAAVSAIYWFLGAALAITLFIYTVPATSEGMLAVELALWIIAFIVINIRLVTTTHPKRALIGLGAGLLMLYCALLLSNNPTAIAVGAVRVLGLGDLHDVRLVLTNKGCTAVNLGTAGGLVCQYESGKDYGVLYPVVIQSRIGSQMLVTYRPSRCLPTYRAVVNKDDVVGWTMSSSSNSAQPGTDLKSDESQCSAKGPVSQDSSSMAPASHSSSDRRETSDRKEKVSDSSLGAPGKAEAPALGTSGATALASGPSGSVVNQINITLDATPRVYQTPSTTNDTHKVVHSSKSIADRKSEGCADNPRPVSACQATKAER